MGEKILKRYRSRQDRRVSVAHYKRAIVAMLLLGLIAATMLVVQLRGYYVPAWVPLTLALLLFMVLRWVL